ncbi:molecular chaperone Hsp90 [Megasphaera sp.]|uniref:molecular chaperone Hsp90 n=1 Tax=Megasphaera sp. TaxID=2023260 RepID=UPI0040277046
MDAKTVEFVTAKTHDLMAVPSCNPTLKTAAQTWLDAADKDAAAPAYIEALKQGVSTIDELLDFAASEHAVQIMGADAAKQLLAHAKDIQTKGAKFCDCPACTADLAILRELKAI